MNNKLLPHDYDSEAGLLAAAFCPGGLDNIKGLVSADDFYSSSANLIFGKMTEFHESGRNYTPSLVDQTLEGHSQYEDIRRALDVLVPITATIAPHFAQIVRELADRRRAIKASSEALEGLFDLSKAIPRARGFLRVEVPGMLMEVIP